MPGLTWAYELRYQVTENPLPLPFRAPGRAFVAPEELIIVISS